MKPSITLILDSALAGLTRSGKRQAAYYLDRRASIKDILESIRIPHTEVGRILSQGAEKDFSHLPQPGEHIEIRSISPPFDVTRPDRLRPSPLSETRFICDVNVGKLAVLLRMIGVDVLMRSDWKDVHIARMAEKEGRIVLTRDFGLLKRNQVEFGRLIRSRMPDGQIQEVVHFFGLTPGPWFTRCLRCNAVLHPVEKTAIRHLLLPGTRKNHTDFFICPECKRIYWQGSHTQEMRIRLNRLGLY